MKIVAITGGAQGIGRGIAYHFARAGYAVSLADPDQDAGAEALAKLHERGAKAVFVPTDVAQEDEVERWMEQTVQGLGCPDVLVNNASIGCNKPFLELSAAEFDRVIGVNLRGTFLCSQAVGRRSAAARSITSLRPAPSCRSPAHGSLYGLERRHSRAHPLDPNWDVAAQPGASVVPSLRRFAVNACGVIRQQSCEAAAPVQASRHRRAACRHRWRGRHTLRKDRPPCKWRCRGLEYLGRGRDPARLQPSHGRRCNRHSVLPRRWRA